MVWVVAVVAVLIALDKSLLPGAAILGIGALATVLPAKEATGVSLALIIIADWTAIWAYRGNVDWRTLRRLMPPVLVGVVAGAGFLMVADDFLTRKLIGTIILVFVTWNLVAMAVKKRHAKSAEAQLERTQSEGAASDESNAPADGETASKPRNSAARAKSLVFGPLAGFTTMVANAGGPVTSMYFMTEGFPVRLFLGTTAWFYLVLNLIKLPFSLGLGMIHADRLPMIASMIPVIVVTVLIGRWCSSRINPRVFNVLVTVLTLVTGVTLLV